MRNFFKALMAVLCVVLVPCDAWGQLHRKSLISEKQAEAVDVAMTAEMTKQRAVGLALGIIRDGKIAYIRGYGFEDRESQVHVTSKTMFRWASISKTLTAVAAMQLVEQNRLNLDANVRQYVDEFPIKDAVITARQLLCHQGGIVHYFNGKVVQTQREYSVPHPFENVIVALDRFKDSPLIAQPGEGYSYTTHGYILLSAVVQRAGEQRYADQIRERIAKPLGMTTLQPDYQWKEIPHRAVGYRLRNGEVVRSTDTDVSWKLGGGGFVSNIDDLARWATALINGRVVSTTSEKQMWKRQQTASGTDTKMGLGFFVEMQGETLKVSHSGSQEKTRTRLVIYPRLKHGMVVMTNSENAKPTAFATLAYQALRN